VSCFRKFKNFIPFFIVLGLLAFGLHSFFPNALASLGGWKVDSLNQGLVGHWPLDGEHFNPITNRVDDISGYGNHGTNNGATLATDRYGQSNGAMGFNGTGNYIDFGSLLSSSWASATVSFWRKADDTNAWLLFKGQTTGFYFMATHGTDNFYHANCGSPTIYRDGVVAMSPATDGNWHHYVATGVNFSSWTSFQMSNYSNFHIHDEISDLRIYNRALSEDEIARLYESYKPKLSASTTNKGLAAHYSFDDFGEYTENLMTYNQRRFLGPSYREFAGNLTGATEQGHSILGVTEDGGTLVTVPPAPNGDTSALHWSFLNRGVGKEFAGSAWIHNIGNYNIAIRFSNGISSLTTQTVTPGEIAKVEIKGLSTSEYNHRFAIQRGSKDHEIKIVGYQLQVEEKSYFTPFIDGIREDLVKDSSGYFSHSTLDSNTPKWVEEDDSRTGVYEFFKGEQRRIQLPDPYLGTKTISFWVKVKAGEHTSSEVVPFLAYNDGVITGSGDTRQILLCMQSNKFRMHGWGTADPITTSNINDGEWHHLVWHMNHDATDANQRLMNMWVDGSREVTDFNYSQGSFGPVADSYWWVGYNSRSYSSYIRDAGILIDDIRFYDRKLSDDEVDSLYHKGKIGSSVEVSTSSLYKGLVLDMPLTAEYTKDETPGSEIMADTTPYGNDGQNYGATITSDGAEFNGTSDYISRADFNIGSDPIFSVSMWIKRTASFSGGGYWGLGGGSSWNGISGYTPTSNRVAFDLWGRTTYLTDSIYPLNEWVHVVWIKNGTGDFNSDKLQIWVNSEEKGLTQHRYTSGTPSLVNGFAFGRISTNYNGYRAPGSVQNIKIYNRALSPTEVKSLYDKGR
jgi:hypothetical protein